MAEPSDTKQTKRVEKAVGKVMTAGGFKTCSVAVNRLVRHPLYGKYVRRRTKLSVHDPVNEAQVGDMVEITPCRPISKTKRWRLVRIVKKTAISGM